MGGGVAEAASAGEALPRALRVAVALVEGLALAVAGELRVAVRVGVVPLLPVPGGAALPLGAWALAEGRSVGGAVREAGAEAGGVAVAVSAAELLPVAGRVAAAVGEGSALSVVQALREAPALPLVGEALPLPAP